MPKPASLLQTSPYKVQCWQSFFKAMDSYLMMNVLEREALLMPKDTHAAACYRHEAFKEEARWKMPIKGTD